MIKSHSRAGDVMQERSLLERESISLLVIIHSSWKLIGRYYILRDEMLSDLTSKVGELVQGNAPWQVGLPFPRFRCAHSELDLSSRTSKRSYTASDIRPRQCHSAKRQAYQSCLEMRSSVD